MKRCPKCRHVETDDTLAFCRADGTPLVRESGEVNEAAGTLKFSSQPPTGETPTRIVPTGESAGSPTETTTVLNAQPATGWTQGLSKSKSHPNIIIGAVVLTAFVLAVSTYLYFSRGKDSDAKNSIAVLPFQNASNDPDMEYLSDGISESIINSLSQLPNVRVLARSTMFTFKGKELNPQDVGRQLGVVLTGRVMQRGDSLTVQTDLVNVADGSQLWGERYNRTLTDVLAVQEEIVRDVSQKLQARLLGEGGRKAYTANHEAYQLYLKGRFFWSKRTAKDLEKAIQHFQQAIAIDPNYALAYTGLADSYALTPFYGGAQPREAMPKAREAARKALSLDDGLAEAHAALGLILNDYDYDFAGAEREYRRALELNPNYVTARQWRGELLIRLGRHDEAVAEMRRALNSTRSRSSSTRYTATVSTSGGGTTRPSCNSTRLWSWTPVLPCRIACSVTSMR